MDFTFYLPVWAILYCGLIFANGIITIILSKNKSIIYTLGQLLSTAFFMSFFFIYYGVVAKPEELMVLVLMLGFILFQEIWVNKELYERVIFEQIPNEQREAVLFTLGVVMLIFLMPFFYVVSALFSLY